MSTPRVMLVEDNAVTRKLVRFTLESDGIEVHEAARAVDATAVAARCRPDLVLLDLVLPDGSGFDLLKELRDLLGSSVPVLAFTGLLPADDEGRLASAGFDDVVSKPVEPSRLREVLRAYLPMQGGPQVEAFGTGRRLLVVDDDPVQRKLAMFRLGRLGFSVIGAGDGEEGLELARSNPPDAVVSDLLMPKIDGFELCSRLRADAEFPQIPIILVTNSYLEESDRALAERVGADAYVVRTPDLQDLTAALRKALSEARQKRVRWSDVAPEVHGERAARAVRQLDRQVALNSTLAQRSAMLSAELTILGSLTSALAENRDVDAALDDSLSACFDAGGISWGILLIRNEQRTWSYRTIGLRDEQLALLPKAGRALVQRLQFSPETRTPYTVTVAQVLGLDDTSKADGVDVTEAQGNALVTPIVHRNSILGAVVLGIGDRVDDHRVAFAGVVAGQIALVLALARSFRDLERASADERARAQVLSSVLDAIGEPLLVLDAEGFPSHANRAAQHLELFRAHGTADNSMQLGLYRSDLTTLYTHGDLPTTRALRGDQVEDEELVIRRPNGDPQWMQVTARPIRGDDDKIEGVVAVVRDVTQEKRSQAQQIASDRLASIGVLAAGIAHEINNPLTSVIAELDMAIEDTEPAHRSMDRLQAARDAAGRVQTIVRDLRTLSRNETDDVATPVEVRRVLDTALRMALPQTRQCANVTIEVTDGTPLVFGNEARLVQVFLNLLVNAAQAIPPGHVASHTIRVAARESNDGVVIEVTDDGAGMTPEVRQRLFTPFFTTKPVGTGTGLGLSISHRIIASAGGTIDCESAPGKGTTFRVWLPKAPAFASRDSAPSSMSSVDVRLRILVIDEDPLAFQIIGRALRPEHVVVQSRSPGEALSRLQSDVAFDVILCDVETHGASCRTFYDDLCMRSPELGPRVAFLCGRSGAHSSGLPRKPLHKPFDGPTLRRFLREHVASIARGDS